VATILIVEDEEQVRVLAECALQDHGHKTLTAATVDEALALLKGEEPIDVLFTDISLMDQVQGGLALAQQASELRPGLVVIYTTGQGVTDGLRALFVEPFAFISKPYTPTDVAAALTNLLDERQRPSR
jgi:DNA-binding NtrC family response regulator